MPRALRRSRNRAASGDDDGCRARIDTRLRHTHERVRTRVADEDARVLRPHAGDPTRGERECSDEERGKGQRLAPEPRRCAREEGRSRTVCAGR